MADASLTSEPEKLLPVIQADREAAALMHNVYGGMPTGRDMMRSGEADNAHAVQAFARHRLSSPVSGTDGRERLALEAIKAVTATAKDAVQGLSRIMAITRSAGVDAPYSDLIAKPDVALIVNSPRTEWRHLFERPEGCTIPPEGWTCSRTPGHDGPCAASPNSTIPVIAEAGEREVADAHNHARAGDYRMAYLKMCEAYGKRTPATLDNTAATDRDAIRREIINTPETADFMAGVPLEAVHQRERWGVDHDAGKGPLDWFWLIGYLAQKAADAAIRGDDDKAKHHTISTAAALANWHAALTGADTSMRPGIEPPATLTAKTEKAE